MSKYTYVKRNLPDWDEHAAAELKISIKAYVLKNVLLHRDRAAIMERIHAEVQEFVDEFDEEDVEREIGERYRAELLEFASEAYDRAVRMVGMKTPHMFTQILTTTVKDRHGRQAGVEVDLTSQAATNALKATRGFNELGFNRGIEAGRFYGDVQKDIKSQMRDYTDFKAAASRPYLINVNQRNIVEMGVRFKAYQDLKRRMIDDGVRLVYVAPHANCSKRCQPWQGRVYSLDGSKGTVDGRSFIPIEDAAENVTVRGKRDPSRVYAAGLFAYNCRHTMTEYERGQKIEVIPADVIERQREIETAQRELEREIRALREKHLLYKQIFEVTEDAKIKAEMAVIWKLYLIKRKNYYDFCERNKIPQLGDRLKVVTGEDIYQRTFGKRDSRVKNIKISRP